jgi:DNA polymerase III subunit epsilon
MCRAKGAIMKMLIFDTETTGLPLPKHAPIHKQPKIIELGILEIISTARGQKIIEHSWLCNPKELLDPKITKITGITDAMLEKQKEFRQHLGEIEDVFANTFLAYAHNAVFDINMLEFELHRCARTGFPMPDTVCTMQEYKHEFGKVMKLKDLYEKKVGRPLDQTHRALDDCKALYEILKADETL